MMRSFIFTLLLLFSIPSVQADGIKTGLWELKTETYKGIPLELIKSKKEKECLTADYLNNVGNELSSVAKMTGECKEVSKTINSNYLDLAFSCDSKDTSLLTRYNIQIKGERLMGEYVTTGTYKGKKGMETTKITGNYIGNCKQ